MTLPTELQGQGTYDYRCSDPNCAYCISMGLIKPIPEPRFEWKPRNKSVIKPIHKWTPEENEILKANQDLYWREIAKLVPLHPIDSVAVQLTRLRASGFLRQRLVKICFSAKD